MAPKWGWLGIVISAALLFAFVIPGIIGFLWVWRKNPTCPDCGKKNWGNSNGTIPNMIASGSPISPIMPHDDKEGSYMKGIGIGIGILFVVAIVAGAVVVSTTPQTSTSEPSKKVSAPESKHKLIKAPEPVDPLIRGTLYEKLEKVDDYDKREQMVLDFVKNYDGGAPNTSITDMLALWWMISGGEDLLGHPETYHDWYALQKFNFGYADDSPEIDKMWDVRYNVYTFKGNTEWLFIVDTIEEKVWPGNTNAEDTLAALEVVAQAQVQLDKQKEIQDKQDVKETTRTSVDTNKLLKWDALILMSYKNTN